MVRLLDTSGKKEVDAIKIVSDIDRNTITKQSKDNNKSTYKDAHRDYYIKNRERILGRAHQRYIENREYWKDYYERIKKTILVM